MPSYSYDHRPYKEASSALFHVAPKHALKTILEDGFLKSKRSADSAFLSFSEKPLIRFKTEGGGAVFVFNLESMRSLLVPVDYRDPVGFLAAYPEQGAYVAHYTPVGSFAVPPKWVLREYGADTDAEKWSVMFGTEGDKYRVFFETAKQLVTFSKEREWVTKLSGQEIPLRPPYLNKIMVIQKDFLPSLRQMVEHSSIQVPVTTL